MDRKINLHRCIIILYFIIISTTLHSCKKNIVEVSSNKINTYDITSIKNLTYNSFEISGFIKNFQKLPITDFGILLDTIGDQSRLHKISLGNSIKDSVNFNYKLEGLRNARNYFVCLYFVENNITTSTTKYYSFTTPDIYKDTILNCQIAFFGTFAFYPSSDLTLCSTNNKICGTVNPNGVTVFKSNNNLNSVKSISFIFVNDNIAIGDIIKFNFSDMTNMNFFQTNQYSDKKNYTFAIGQTSKTVNVFFDSGGIYLQKKQNIYFTINSGSNTVGPQLYINGNLYQFPINTAGTIDKSINEFTVTDMIRIYNLQFNNRTLSSNEAKYLANAL